MIEDQFLIKITTIPLETFMSRHWKHYEPLFAASIWRYATEDNQGPNLRILFMKFLVYTPLILRI